MTAFMRPGARRPVAMFAFAVLLAAVFSRALGFDPGPVMLLWLPGPVVLVGLLTRGATVLAPAAVGAFAWTFWIDGLPVERAAWLTASVTIAPAAAWRAILWLRGTQRARSHLVQASQLMGVICLVQAPIAAALGLPAIGLGTDDLRSVALAYFAYLAIEATSGVLFVRGMMTWMPADGSGFCPVAGFGGGIGTIRRGGLPALARTAVAMLGRVGLGALAVIVALGLVAAASVAAGERFTARVLLIPVFACALVAALLTNRRASSLVLFVASIVIVALRVRIEPFSVSPRYLIDIVQLELLLLVGGALLHLLNALTEERLAQQRRLESQALSSDLTGLPNLRALTRELRRRARRSADTPLRLAEVAVSDMSRWADLLGRGPLIRFEREAGRLLAELAGSRLILLAQVGAGRYVLVLGGAHDDALLRDTVQARFEAHRFDVGGRPLGVRCTVGVVDVPARRAIDVEATLAALSIAQRTAGLLADRFHRLDNSHSHVRAYRGQLGWVESVRQMLLGGSLRLYAQPIAPADLSPDAGLHYEVLARMVDASGAVVPPARFLPALAQGRLMQELDRRVIGRFCAQLAADPALRQATVFAAINVTGPSLCDTGFADFVVAEVRRHGVDPHRIAIEITESESIADLDVALETAASLRAAGMRIAIDDFGTGLATFEYVRRFEPQVLKIDGTFVRAHATNPLDREIARSIVRFAAALGAATVAECVETAAQCEQMRALGVDFLQGYAIARPMPLEDLKRFCDSRRAEIATERRERATPVMPAHRPAHRPADDCVAACAPPAAHGAPARVS